MSEKQSTTLSTVLEYLHLTLRYVASGFVAIAIFVFLGGNFDTVTKNYTEEKSGFLLLLTATIGLITYALHFATMDKIFNGICVSKFLNKNDGYLPSVLIDSIEKWNLAKNKLSKLGKEQTGTENESTIKYNIGLFQKIMSFFKKYYKKGIKKINPLVVFLFGETKSTKPLYSKREILFALANQAYLRTISPEKTYTEIQTLLEKRLALLNFLYCSCYQSFIIAVSFFVYKVFKTKSLNIPSSDLVKIGAVLCLVLVIMICAFLFNKRICAREMWVAENFPLYNYQVIQKKDEEN